MAESNPRRLDQPKVRNRRLALDLDPEAFGKFSEGAARFMGTGKFLFWQTLVVILWIGMNLVWGLHRGLWDPYPFILLNLLFSTQAAYAAPLILLAQNRQDDRDRISLEDDRSRATQTKADTEFLARELAALRVAIGEVATRDYLRGEIERLRSEIEELSAPRRGDGKKAKGRTTTKPKHGGQGKPKHPKPDRPRASTGATPPAGAGLPAAGAIDDASAVVDPKSPAPHDISETPEDVSPHDISPEAVPGNGPQDSAGSADDTADGPSSRESTDGRPDGSAD